MGAFSWAFSAFLLLDARSFIFSLTLGVKCGPASTLRSWERIATVRQFGSKVRGDLWSVKSPHGIGWENNDTKVNNGTKEENKRAATIKVQLNQRFWRPARLLSLGCRIRLKGPFTPGSVVTYSYFEKGCRKNVHATIPKGNVGYDQYSVSDDCTYGTYFCCFPLALANTFPRPFVAILSNFFKEQWT